MRILITGGSGFIGAWVVRRLLKRGVDVRIFDISDNRRIIREIVGRQAENLEWRQGDISRYEDVAAAAEGCRGVVHLAGILTPDCRANPVRGASINLIGTLNVFEAAMRNGFKSLVYSSTAGVFGPDDGSTPRPISHYGAFKLAAEGSARAYWADHGFPSVGFRPFVIYGPGRETGASAGASLACRAAARGESCTIPYTGSTGYVYVEDVAAAFEAALFADVTGARVFNLPGQVASVEQIMEEILRQVPEARLKAEGAPLSIACDIQVEELYQVFLGLPRTPLPQGIARTIAHYRTSFWASFFCLTLDVYPCRQVYNFRT